MSDGIINMTQRTVAPSTVPDNMVSIYAKTDNNLYIKDVNGVEKLVTLAGVPLRLDLSGEIDGLTEKSVLVDDDLFIIEDSQASLVKKKSKLSSIISKVFASLLGLPSLTDPNADRILFWDDSAGALKWLTVSTGLSLSGTNLTYSPPSLSWINLSLQNSWVNFDASMWQTARYTKDIFGWVHVNGMVKNGTSGIIATLPVGYRPSLRHIFTVSTDTSPTGKWARLDVEANGQIVAFSYLTGWIAFNVSFHVG